MTGSVKRSTNIDLDRDLLDRAITALGGSVSIKDTVEEGLRRIVAEHALHDLAASIAEMDAEQHERIRTVRDTAW